MRPTNLSFIFAIDPIVEDPNISFFNLLARALVFEPAHSGCRPWKRLQLKFRRSSFPHLVIRLNLKSLRGRPVNVLADGHKLLIVMPTASHHGVLAFIFYSMFPNK